MMLDTPVLFLIFNRPEITNRAFEEICRARPKRLYIAADGPRSEYPDDMALCEKARQICRQVDWDCEVKTLYQKENLGCQYAVSGAIDWFFDNEVEGIILEDDCLASQSFFQYCSELLDYHRDNKQIMCVSGNNFQQERNVSDDSYYYSRYPHCWGWATWKSAWLSYDPGMDNWEEERNVGIFDQWSDACNEFREYWATAFDAAVTGKVDSWAYRWLYSCWKQQGLSCLPQKNLVKNIGFTEESTHTNQSDIWYSNIEKNELSFPLRHPRLKRRNVKADEFTDINVYGILNKEKKLKFMNYFCSVFTSLKIMTRRGM
jgi:hypothetical protein